MHTCKYNREAISNKRYHQVRVMVEGHPGSTNTHTHTHTQTHVYTYLISRVSQHSLTATIIRPTEKLTKVRSRERGYAYTTDTHRHTNTHPPTRTLKIQRSCILSSSPCVNDSETSSTLVPTEAGVLPGHSLIWEWSDVRFRMLNCFTVPEPNRKHIRTLMTLLL
jgi:hypothetical protein